MPPTSQSFTALNSSSEPTLPECMDYFTLSAPPNTDLWRKPPSQDTCTSPILYTRLNHPFVAAEVTVSADWEMEWDQGGLVIFAGRPPSPPPRLTHNTQTPLTTSPLQPLSPTPIPTPSTDSPPPYPHPPPPSQTPAAKWVKAGLEFCNGQPHASSVSATSDGADWAMSPLSPFPSASHQPPFSAAPPAPPRNAYQPNYSSLRIKLERIGHALWIWFCADPPPYRAGSDTVDDGDDVLGDWRLCGGGGGGVLGGGAGGMTGGGWKKLREVTWFFWGVDDKCVRVGVYASRPANFGVSQYARVHGGEREGEGRGLEVEFEGLEIF